MFNPSNLKIVIQGKDIRNPSPFVGIQKAQDGELEFCLPFGFDDFPENDSEKLTKFFFSLYRTFQHFQKYIQANFPRKSSNTEGTIQKEKGFTFVDKEGESVTLSSKIANIDSVLIGYDELRIFSIVQRPRRTQQIKYDQIDKYLHQAVYLKGHIPFVDEMILPQPIIEYSITDLVRMYCFVYVEIKRQLDETENIPVEIIDQAQLFRENNLQPDSSLFSSSHDFTIQLLRFELDEIARQVVLKDNDYWHFYKALEDFLYGIPNYNNEGVFWGITSFALVWEDMCINYMYQQDWEGVWFADSSRDFANTQLDKYNKIYLSPEFENPFYLAMNSQVRYLRPDLVRVNNFDVDEWFDKGFEVTYPSMNSCNIRLKITNKEYRSTFNNGLNYRINKRCPGTRPKNESSNSHTYYAVTKSKIEEIKREVKAHFKELQESKNPPHHLIVDFKYVNHAAFIQPTLPKKIKKDINKQLIYEYAVTLNKPQNLAMAKSQFCIPYFFESITTKGEVLSENLNEVIKDQEIEILKLFSYTGFLR
jgi:hypothetical protein